MQRIYAIRLSMDNIIQNYSLTGIKIPIYTYPAPVLKKVAKPVDHFGEDITEFCHNMLYTMYVSRGVGLAAPQVGLSKRFFVMDVDYTREEVKDPGDDEKIIDIEYENFCPRIFINPVIEEKSGEILYEEGCLSLPGISEKVKRYESIVVSYQDTNGDKHSLEATGLFSVCIQHEIDHLDGIVFWDRLSPLKRNLLAKKYKKANLNAP